MKYACLMTFIAAGLAPAAFGQVELCVEGAGDCFVAHETPGCQQSECCEFICVELGAPYCCDTIWDASCADAALTYCEPPACPGKESCFEQHEAGGCNDEDCCKLTCSVDGFCCTWHWDALCVQEATLLCGEAPIEIVPPPGAELEAELCDEHLDDGCNLAVPAFESVECGTVRYGTCTASSPRDTDWYELSISQESNITFSVTAEFPALLLVLHGECLGAVTTLGKANALPGETGSIDMCLQPGTYWLFVSTGTEVRPIRAGIPCTDDPKSDPGFYGNDYRIEVGCRSCSTTIVGDINGDGAVNGADLGLLLASWTLRGPADLNGDGVVDGADLGILLASWTG